MKFAGPKIVFPDKMDVSVPHVQIKREPGISGGLPTQVKVNSEHPW